MGLNDQDYKEIPDDKDIQKTEPILRQDDFPDYGKMTVEEQLAFIESLVSTLEKDDLPLDAALKAFEQGIRLIRQTDEQLTEAKTRLETLTESGDLI